ncbi:MAG1430 family protein [Mycoplasma sp. Z244C]
MKKSSKLFIAYGIIGGFALGGIIGTSIAISQQKRTLTIAETLDKYTLNKTASLEQEKTLASQYATSPLNIKGEWNSAAWSKELILKQLITREDVENKKFAKSFYLYNGAKPLKAIFNEKQCELITFKSYANDVEGVLYLQVTYPVTDEMKAQDPKLGDNIVKVYSLGGFSKIAEYNPYATSNTIIVTTKSADIKKDFENVAKFKESYEAMLKNTEANAKQTWFEKYFNFDLAPVTALSFNQLNLTFGENDSVTIHYTYGYKVLAATKDQLDKVEEQYPENDSQGSETFNDLFKAVESTQA